MLVHLPSGAGYLSRPASSRWLPLLQQQEALHNIQLHWGMLTEALPCNAVDFVCSCLIEVERTSETRHNYFFDDFGEALLALLRQRVLLQMQNMPDVGANGQFLVYQRSMSINPCTSSRLTSPPSLLAGSTEFPAFVEESFRSHTAGTGARWVADLYLGRTIHYSTENRSTSAYANSG